MDQSAVYENKLLFDCATLLELLKIDSDLCQQKILTQNSFKIHYRRKNPGMWLAQQDGVGQFPTEHDQQLFWGFLGMEFSREKIFREGIGQVSIPLTLDNLILVRFHNWELDGFILNCWLVFLHRNCLILCSVGQRPIWFWFQDQSEFFGSGFMSGCVPFVLLS